VLELRHLLFLNLAFIKIFFLIFLLLDRGLSTREDLDLIREISGTLRAFSFVHWLSLRSIFLGLLFLLRLFSGSSFSLLIQFELYLVLINAFSIVLLEEDVFFIVF